MADQSIRPPGQGGSRNVATIANWAGASVSLALVVGIGVWGYKLMVRDVSGVPVIEASGGPMRVAPDDPGGNLARNQGLAVNSVAGTGKAAPPADQVVLAPSPVLLGEDDIPLLVSPEVKTERVSLQVGEADLRLGREDGEELSAEELVDLLTGDAQPLGDVAPASGQETPLVTASLEPAASQFKGGVARSLRPKTRPGNLQRTAALAAPVADATGSVKELDAGSLAKGTRLVQLGAFDSAETARKEWARLDGQFGDFLEGKDRVIQRATSGGRTFYRLRAHGFADMADARRFCSALMAGRADCIPVTTR